MDREFLLRMSYMEIYNEEINDLLAPEHRKLQIHESLEVVIYFYSIYLNVITRRVLCQHMEHSFLKNEERHLCCWLKRRNCGFC